MTEIGFFKLVKSLFVTQNLYGFSSCDSDIRGYFLFMFIYLVLLLDISNKERFLGVLFRLIGQLEDTTKRNNLFVLLPFHFFILTPTTKRLCAYAHFVDIYFPQYKKDAKV